MGFWDRLFTGLFGQSTQSEQPTDNGPEPDSAPTTAPSTGGFWSNLFGRGGGNSDPNDGEISNPERDQAETDLDAFAPEDRSQGLFFLGWVDPNVSNDVRAAARRKWEQEYGEWNPRKGRNTMTDEGWEKWRRYMGYGRS